MGRLTHPVALVVAALALAGCGGADGDADVPEGEADAGDAVAVYEEQIRAVDGVVRAASERLADDTADPAELEAELTEALRRVDQASPPYDALPEHQRLSQSIGEAVDVSAGLAAAGEPRPTGEVEQLRQALADAVEALDELEEKGYDVRPRT